MKQPKKHFSYSAHLFAKSGSVRRERPNPMISAEPFAICQILAKQLGISTHQLSYVTHSGEGEGLLFYGSTILPFVDHFPKNTELYRIMTTKPQELKKEDE